MKKLRCIGWTVRDGKIAECGKLVTPGHPNKRYHSDACKKWTWDRRDQGLANGATYVLDRQYVTCPLCEKLGKSILLRRITPEHVATHGVAWKDFRKEYPNVPLTSIATREALSNATKLSGTRRWAKASPRARQQHGKAIKKALADPDVKERQSVAMERAWQDPEKRERIVAGVQKALADPEKTNRRIAGLREALKSPKVRRRFSAARKRDWKKPEVRVKFLKHIDKMVEERVAALAAGRAALRAAAAGSAPQPAAATQLPARPRGRPIKPITKARIRLAARLELDGVKPWAMIDQLYPPPDALPAGETAAENKRKRFDAMRDFLEKHRRRIDLMKQPDRPSDAR